MRRLFVSLALAAALAALTALQAGSAPPAQAQAASPRPNIVVVLTDDQAISEMNAETMPRTTRQLADRGTDFTQSIVSSPLCCPSRAGDLTGQYPHNNDVFDNEPGYPSLADKTSTIYTWLSAAGYRTGHIGRFLLNYGHPPSPSQDFNSNLGLAAPPGVEDWFGYVGNLTYYYGATFSDNGTAVSMGTDPAGYSTRAINREALDFVRTSAADPRPFYLTVAHLAPHASADANGYGECGQAGGLPVPDGGKLGKWADAELPKPPSFDESKIRDKPAWIRSRPGLGAKRRHNLELGWRCANASLSTVDAGVASLVRELRQDGELDNTAIFFTSDNGYMFGEHRVVLNKVYPYEESLRVPLIARVPPQLIGRKARAKPPAEVSTPVNNLDLTATILDLAGASPCTADGDCRVLDGRSLVPLLRGERPDWSRGRALLFQIGGIRSCGVVPTTPGLRNFYDAVRTPNKVYVELNRVNKDTGECDRPEYELYDLRKDPFQLRNQAVNPANKEPSPDQAALAARLAALRDCAGIEGRDAPSAQPYCD